MNPTTVAEVRAPTAEAPKPIAMANPAEILQQQQQRIERLASGIDGGFKGLALEASSTDLSQEKQSLGELKDELKELGQVTQKKLLAITGRGELETEEGAKASTNKGEMVTKEDDPREKYSGLYRSADEAVTVFKRLYGENSKEQTDYERSVRLRVAHAVIEADRDKSGQYASQDAYIKEILELDAQIQGRQDRPNYRQENNAKVPDPENDPNIAAIQKKIAIHPRRLERDVLKGLALDFDGGGKAVRRFLTEVYAISQDPRRQYTDYTKKFSNFDQIAFDYPSTLQADLEYNTQDIKGLRLYEQYVAQCPQSAEVYKDFAPIQEAKARMEKWKAFEDQKKTQPTTSGVEVVTKTTGTASEKPIESVQTGEKQGSNETASLKIPRAEEPVSTEEERSSVGLQIELKELGRVTQKRIEEVTVQPQNINESRPAQAELAKPEGTVHSTPAKALSERLQEVGIESKVIQIRNAGGFTEAIILPKKTIPTEKMVRVYRGVNQLDASLLQQIPYAMRADSEDRLGSVVLESLRQEVDILATEPTYEHLLAYVNKARPKLNEYQQEKIDRDLAKIEDGILEGYSVRTELIYDQIGHNGGFIDSGISPYLSASWSPREALGYTRTDGALLVIDVPISQIEDFGKDGTETNIKGTLDPKYITAIVPRNGVDLREGANEQSIAVALQTVSEAAKVPIYDSVEAQIVRGNQIAVNREADKQQQQVDVEVLRQKRTASLFVQFSEVGLNPQAIQQTASEVGTDNYTKTRMDIFDYYADRFSKLGRGGRNVEDADYFVESEYGVRKKFDRTNINDEMLTHLRKFVQRQEAREQERISKK